MVMSSLLQMLVKSAEPLISSIAAKGTSFSLVQWLVTLIRDQDCHHRQVRFSCNLHSSPEICFTRNYTGDVLNFGLAKEQYVALHPDEADRVKFVIVGDDVAVGRTQGKIVGRRYDHNIITE